VALDTEVSTATVPTIVVVGSASRDLTDEDPRGWRLGGAVTYAALTLARLGLRTGAVMGVDAEAQRAHELDVLRRAGVNLVTVPLEHGPVFINDETPSGRVQTAVDVGQPLPISALPGEWAIAPGWLLGPVAGELGDEWASPPPESAVVALGWQGLLRTLIAGQQVQRRPPARSAVLERADLMGASMHDLGAETSLAELAAMFAPQAELLLTTGDRGGTLFRMPFGQTRPLRYPAVFPARVADATGAGDVTLACMLAGRLTERAGPADLGWGVLRRRHLRLAATAASLAVEESGLGGVPQFAALCGRLETGDADPQPA
jgi:sugar/nucleoside kinase (ribokinase family)